MDLLQIIRNIQYQTAKIEVIELLYWHTKINNPSLDTEIIHNLFATVRQNLFYTSEACLTANPESLVSCIGLLRNSITTTNQLLFQTNNNLNASDIRVVFLKDLLNKIAEELISLNAALSQLDLQPVEENITEISSYSDDSIDINEPEITSVELDETVEDIDTSIDKVMESESIDSATEETLKKLDIIPVEVDQIVEANHPSIEEVVESEFIDSTTSETPENRDFEILTQLCDEDSEQAESWIEFEQQRNSELTREDAIASAIQINSNLQDKFNLLLLIQKIICEYLEVEANDIEINNDTNLSEFYNPYIDSTDMWENLMNLEEILDVDIPDEVSWGDALPRNTVGYFIDFIIKELEKKHDLEIEEVKLEPVQQSEPHPVSSYNKPVSCFAFKRRIIQTRVKESLRKCQLKII